MSLTTLPPRRPVEEAAYAALRDLVAHGGLCVLSGAGMSTASGIPDYRGPDGTRRVQPMQHAEFVGSAAARRRYWARSHVGWRRFASARPNPAHVAVARLQRLGLLDGVITQNVDGLHQRAGARDVLELHGSLGAVVCRWCGARSERLELHARLTRLNPAFEESVGPLGLRPDGDVALPERLVQEFRVAPCLVCGSDLLQPDVVFFGGSVPRERVDRAYHAVQTARSLLVLGSSLRVMSGLRFVRRARQLDLPVALVTRGDSRGDRLVTVRLDALLGDVLPRLVDDLTRG